MKKKILIFNGYYYPSKNYGGPNTSIENIVNACCDEFDFYIVCYNHDFGDLTPFSIEVNKWHKHGNAKVMYVESNYLDFSIKRMGALFQSLSPDLIWFSGVLTPNNKIVAVSIARKMHIPVLFSPRGEVSADRVRLKAYKKIPYLLFLKALGIYKGCYYHATSDDELEGIKKYFNPASSNIFKIANISIMQQPDTIKCDKKSGSVRLIFFSRIHEVKNLLFAINCVCNCRQKVIFDIYGPIESEEYWDKCLEIIKSAPENAKINYCGTLQHDNMGSTIQSYDAFLFPTLNENYGHVIAETLANSRPVILSKGTTPWDDLDKRAGYVIDLGNRELFSQTIDSLAQMDMHEYSNLLESTKKYFSEKIGKDSAIKGHKDMIHNIVNG